MLSREAAGAAPAGFASGARAAAACWAALLIALAASAGSLGAGAALVFAVAGAFFAAFLAAFVATCFLDFLAFFATRLVLTRDFAAALAERFAALLALVFLGAFFLAATTDSFSGSNWRVGLIFRGR